MKFKIKGFGHYRKWGQGIGFGNYGLDYTNYVQYSRSEWIAVYLPI